MSRSIRFAIELPRQDPYAPPEIRGFQRIHPKNAGDGLIAGIHIFKGRLLEPEEFDRDIDKILRHPDGWEKAQLPTVRLVYGEEIEQDDSTVVPQNDKPLTFEEENKILAQAEEIIMRRMAAGESGNAPGVLAAPVAKSEAPTEEAKPVVEAIAEKTAEAPTKESKPVVEGPLAKKAAKKAAKTKDT